MKKQKILVLGGYGGNNVGDDAQLAGSLEFLSQNFPAYTVVTLTPDMKQTYLRHATEAVGFASRNALFDFDVKPEIYVRWWKPEHKKWLLTRYKFIVDNVRKYFSGGGHKLSKRQVDFCENIKTASLIYYVGGGYLMGPTASRLWDAALVAEIAQIYETPIVFSGHNIGIWENPENQEFGKKLFGKSRLITTRDRVFSKKELESIGICGDHIYATCDDALFLKTNKSKDKVDKVLDSLGLRNDDFIAFSFHDLNVATEIFEVIKKYETKNILIIPTCPPDVKVQESFISQIKGEERVKRVDKLLTFSETKEIFSRSLYCISTRHHPLIFTLSASKPCISINTTEYFSKKNYGALNLCNIDNFNIDFDKENIVATQEAIKEGILKINRDYDLYRKLISESFYRINAARDRFKEDISAILNSSAAYL